MPIVQISRIQHRRGLKTDLPQLAAGELGWVVDEQRLFIGNGTVADGAPAVGNTEIVTAGSSSFTSALSYVYKGYLGDSTVVGTGASGDVTRTLQQRLDDYVSIKAFDAKGDNSTDDTAAIQRALDELYSDTDQDDTRARRILFFPAGIYKTSSALTIPPFAHLVGEGPDKSIISNIGNNLIAVTEDDDGNGFGSIGAASATTPTQIQFSNLTFKTNSASGGISFDCVSKVYVNQCKFVGDYSRDSVTTDTSTSKGISARAQSGLKSSHLVFNQCQIRGFARLVDFSYNIDNVTFNNCEFNNAYYGALLGETQDGSTTGLDVGPRDIKFLNSTWENISQQAIFVKPAAGADSGVGPRNIISHGNWYSSTVGNNFEGVGSIREVPIIQFDNDECSSVMDFFERSDLRRSDGSSELNAAPELQGIGIQTKAIKSQTLANNTSTATTFNEYPALAGKGLKVVYKIVRGTLDRTGELVVSASTNGVSFDDTFTESGADLGVELSAVLDNKDSTAGSETVALKFTTTSTGTDATIDYQTTIIA